MRTAITLLGLLLTGCVSKSVYLQHPVSGQVVKCDSIGGLPPPVKMFRESREECQVRWQHQGYQEVEPTEKVLAAPRADRR
jgi:hypothetical protein